MFLTQLDHNQVYFCLIQITASNFSETHFNMFSFCDSSDVEDLGLL
jgi:hypothetical protein